MNKELTDKEKKEYEDTEDFMILNEIAMGGSGE